MEKVGHEVARLLATEMGFKLMKTQFTRLSMIIQCSPQDFLKALSNQKLLHQNHHNPCKVM